MVRESIMKMKNGKALGTSGILSEMVKVAWVAGVYIITDVVNQIIVEGVIPAEWKLSTIANFNKGKGDSLEKGKCRALKLTDPIQKTAERIAEMLLRQQVGIDEMQFGFVPGCGTTNAIFMRNKEFILRIFKFWGSF